MLNRRQRLHLKWNQCSLWTLTEQPHWLPTRRLTEVTNGNRKMPVGQVWNTGIVGISSPWSSYSLRAERNEDLAKLIPPTLGLLTIGFCLRTALPVCRSVDCNGGCCQKLFIYPRIDLVRVNFTAETIQRVGITPMECIGPWAHPYRGDVLSCWCFLCPWLLDMATVGMGIGGKLRASPPCFAKPPCTTVSSLRLIEFD